MHKEKLAVIVDTDVFGDPDDILAITYLLANTDTVDIKLIVTADEHKGMRAAWLQNYFQKSDISTPIVAGEDLGHTRLYLLDSITTDTVNFDYIDAIKKVIDSAKNIIYLCMAPQSNLAAFISKFPEYADRIEVRGMGAVLDMDLGRIEHNVKYDIEAFRTVAQELSPTLLLADHTWHDSMKFHRQTEIYKFLKNSDHALAQAIITNADAFYDKLYPESRFHDPILASTLLIDSVSFSPEKIIIEENGFTRRPTDSETGISVSVSTHVDYIKVYNNFFESLKKFLR